jgi:hypothetical protein
LLRRVEFWLCANITEEQTASKTLMMEAVCSFENLAHRQNTTGRNNPDHHIYIAVKTPSPTNVRVSDNLTKMTSTSEQVSVAVTL